jgi:hypothetical protein
MNKNIEFNKRQGDLKLQSLDETESNGITGRIGYVSVSKLKPTQNQIWLEKLIDNFIRYGQIDENSEILDNTIIISKEGYILDGHHRYGQVMLSNPELKIKVYSWIYDSLIKYRNNSGDSYKKMTGALWNTQENKSNFSKDIVEIANKIKVECDVTDWQQASEDQLKLRDKIHEYIALLSDIIRNRENLLDISFTRAKQEVKN